MKGRFSSTTMISARPSANSSISEAISGWIIASRRSRTPRARSSASSRPRMCKAWRMSRYVLPAATMPMRAVPPKVWMRLSRLASA